MSSDETEKLNTEVSKWLSSLDSALSNSDIDAAVALFHDDSFWRDLISFTWNIKTSEGAAEIRRMLEATLANTRPGAWARDGDASEADGIVESWFTFDTAVARGKGHLRLRDGKCFTLLTSTRELKGFEEKTAANASREHGVEHGVVAGRKSWKQKRDQEIEELGYSKQPYCVIVGGGQGGIALAARLKRLQVPAIVIEKNDRPGDSWRKRYRSLCLHDPVWYDHLPYLPFPDHWPVFSPKDKVGDWLESYTKIMEINYWNSTECQSAHYDESSGEWTVEVMREGKPVTLKPKQLVLATGMSGVANIPNFAGTDDFKGVQLHSSQHSGGEEYKGKNCIVIGSNNSAHDICADLWESGADVTMVQRSSTHIARSETLMNLALSGLYSEEAVKQGITTDVADLIFASVPYKIMHQFHIPVYEEMKKVDSKLYDGLEKAGFLLDFGEDESGLFMKYLRRGSGYYIDVGASQLIVDGKIKLKSGTEVEQINESSVSFKDGSELPADLIVYATGYGSMNGWAEQLISKDVADKVGKVWGLGSDTTKDPGPWEGELRNMWKPTQQNNLWFHGGNLHQSRHYSQFLSLQLKARMENLDTPVYDLAPTHHVS